MSEELFYEVLAWLWLITWFLAIWIKPVRVELFFTGLFAMVLVLLACASGVVKKDE